MSSVIVKPGKLRSLLQQCNCKELKYTNIYELFCVQSYSPALLCCLVTLSPAIWLTLGLATVKGRLQGQTQFSSLPLPSRRAVLVLKDNVVPMSCEFTPETERQRIQHLVSDSFHA